MAHKVNYSLKDYHLIGKKWTDPEESWLSEFDLKLRKAWDNAMDQGCFKYTLDDMETRHIPGDYSFTARLNVKRVLERRKPDDIQDMDKAYDPQKFNFTKVKEKEILFEMCPVNDKSNFDNPGSKQSLNGTTQSNGSITNGHTQSEDANSQISDDKHLLLINISPLDYGNVLLVPSVNQSRPQVLTEKAIKMGLELLLLTSHPGFKVGFNSLCGLASVNHLHLHAHYTDYKLITETLKVKQIYGHCYEIVNYPVHGFVFQLHNRSVKDVASDAFKVINHLQHAQIAHNVLMTRADSFHDPSLQTIRLYVFVRTKFYGAKQFDEKGVKLEGGPVLFNVAVIELGGLIPCYNAEKFKTVTEEDVLKRMRESRLPDKDIIQFKEALPSVLQ